MLNVSISHNIYNVQELHGDGGGGGGGRLSAGLKWAERTHLIDHVEELQHGWQQKLQDQPLYMRYTNTIQAFFPSA